MEWIASDPVVAWPEDLQSGRGPGIMAALQSGEPGRVAAGLRLAGDNWPLQRDRGAEMRQVLTGLTEDVRRQVVLELTREEETLPSGWFGPEIWRWLQAEQVILTPADLLQVAQTWEQFAARVLVHERRMSDHRPRKNGSGGLFALSGSIATDPDRWTGPLGLRSVHRLPSTERLLPILGRFVVTQFSRLAGAPREQLRPVANILARRALMARHDDPELLAEILTALGGIEPLAAGHVLAKLARTSSVSARQIQVIASALGHWPRAAHIVAVLARATDGHLGREWAGQWQQVQRDLPDETVRRVCLAVLDVPEYSPSFVHSSSQRMARHGDALATALRRGAIWALSAWTDGETRQRLMSVIQAGARSGQGSPVSAHAAIVALERMDCPEAYAALRQVHGQINHKNLRKAIWAALERVGRRQGLSTTEVVDRFVDRHGLGDDAQRAWRLGAYTVILSLTPDGHTELSARDGMGWPYPELPAGARQYGDPIWTEIRTTAQAIQTTLMTEKHRLEANMVAGHRWAAVAWEATFRAHPILANLAGRLVWLRLDSDGQPLGAALPGVSGGWRNGRGEPVQLAEGESLSVLHPLQLLEAERQEWQTWLEWQGIVQPFKQIQREVFRPEGEELRLVDTSARYADAILPQPQLLAITRGCGWSGMVTEGDNGWTGYRDFFEFASVPPPNSADSPAWEGVRAWVMLGCPGLRWDGRHVCIEQVFFHALERERGRWRDAGRLALSDVPPVIFSEAMRDLSLAVSAAGGGG